MSLQSLVLTSLEKKQKIEKSLNVQADREDFILLLEKVFRRDLL